MPGMSKGREGVLLAGAMTLWRSMELWIFLKYELALEAFVLE